MAATLLLQPRRPVDQEAGRVDLHRHVGELLLDRLEVRDAMAERTPLQRVFPRDVVGGLGDPERLRRNADAAAVQRGHRHPEAAVLFVEQTIAAHTCAFDDDVVRHRGVQSQLLLVPRHAHVLGVEDERAHSARSLGVRVGAREQEKRSGMTAVRDPLLRAVEHPAVAVRLRPRAERTCI